MAKVKTRTRLTTPGGAEPEAPAARKATSEYWAPALGRPEELRPVSRARKPLIIIALLLAAVAIGLAGYTLANANANFDPTSEFAPTPELPGEGDGEGG